jgi:hypothetical protein
MSIGKWSIPTQRMRPAEVGARGPERIRRVAMRSRLAWCGAALAVTLLLASGGTAMAQRTQAVDVESGDPNAALARVRELVTFARYDEAVAAAERFLARTDLSAAQRNAGLEALAICQVAMRRDDDARRTLEILYGRDPQHRLSDADASPRVQSAFARVRDARPPRVPVRLELAPLQLQRREAPVVVVRAVAGADAIEEYRLAYRQEGEARFTRIVMAVERGVARARLPLAGDPARPTSIDFFVEAVAPSLTPLATLGSEADPLLVQVPAETTPVAATGGPNAGRVPSPAEAALTDERAPGMGSARASGADWREGMGSGGSDGRADDGGGVTSQWWFWTLLGAAVVGAGVGLYFALGPPSQSVTTGTLGTITLN